MVAPSDMMDNRVGAIKNRLKEAGLGGKVGSFDMYFLWGVAPCSPRMCFEAL